MAIATDAQVQSFSDQRARPFCEAARDIKAAADDFKATVDDVYAACSQASPTWVDGNTSLPPHYITPGELLGINTFVTDLQAFIAGHAQYPVVLKACVAKP